MANGLNTVGVARSRPAKRGRWKGASAFRQNRSQAPLAQRRQRQTAPIDAFDARPRAMMAPAIAIFQPLTHEVIHKRLF